MFYLGRRVNMPSLQNSNRALWVGRRGYKHAIPPGLSRMTLFTTVSPP